jgi:hypothetical protein
MGKIPRILLIATLIGSLLAMGFKLVYDETPLRSVVSLIALFSVALAVVLDYFCSRKARRAGGGR